MGVLRTIQQFLADPNIAFLLLSIGTLGLIYELASPGLGVGGALGVTFILLAMFGLAVLPVEVVGILFLVMAAALFVAEVCRTRPWSGRGGGSTVDGAQRDLPHRRRARDRNQCRRHRPGRRGRGRLRGDRRPHRDAVRLALSSTTRRRALIGQEATVRLGGAGTQAFIQGAWWAVRPGDAEVVVADAERVEVVAWTISSCWSGAVRLPAITVNERKPS